jgi:ABC-type hemin transport system substrate-binding protein
MMRRLLGAAFLLLALAALPTGPRAEEVKRLVAIGGADALLDQPDIALTPAGSNRAPVSWPGRWPSLRRSR